MDQPQLVEAVEKLTAAVGELSDRADTQQEMLNEIKAQRKGLRSTRIVVAFTVFGVSIDLVLTVLFGLLYQQVNANSHQVQAVQERTSSEILCPLYQVFALSIKTNPAPPGLTPTQAQLRQDAGDTILAGLDKLGCT